jgi:bifunctional non-homologous end joining protein LigD
MALETYRRKRDFKRTPEPRGSRGRRTRELSYVIQKHAARRLHYDFRLELDGVLKSWAVPREPSPDSSGKRLAVHVEDHPLDYAGFEGRIPAGEYGAGKVEIWDAGTWVPKGNPRKGYAEGKLSFTLRGRRLSGGWALVRMGGRAAEERRDNWLLIKERDGNERDLSSSSQGKSRRARR